MARQRGHGDLLLQRAHFRMRRKGPIELPRLQKKVADLKPGRNASGRALDEIFRAGPGVARGLLPKIFSSGGR